MLAGQKVIFISDDSGKDSKLSNRIFDKDSLVEFNLASNVGQ